MGRVDLSPRWLLPLGLLAALLVLRIFQVEAAPLDTDEPQHLHIAWGIAQGELPYRDRFDNHTPVFHFLAAPVMAALGERPEIVHIMRWVIFPVGLAGLAMVFFLGRKIFGMECALWSVLVLLAFPDWSVTSLLVRPDVLWMVLWFGVLWVLLDVAKPGLTRFFSAGLLAGLAFLTSIKTVFLLLALVMAWALCWIFRPPLRTPWTEALTHVFAAALGFAVTAIPAGLWLWSQGAWDGLVYCLFEINKVGSESPGIGGWLVLPLLVLAGWVLQKMPKDGPEWEREILFTTITLAAVAVLVLLSPSLRKQTFLPVYPLLVLVLVAFALRQPWFAWVRRPAFAGSLVVVGFAAYSLWEVPLWERGLAAHESLVRDVLKFVPENQTVMDLKGETIYRTRSTFPAYVGVVKRAIRAGHIPDTSIQDAKNNKTLFVTEEIGFLPKESRQFFAKNYLSLRGDQLRVLGFSIPENSRLEIPFEATFVVMGPDGTVPWADSGQECARIFSAGSQRIPVNSTRPLWLVAAVPGRENEILQNLNP